MRLRGAQFFTNAGPGSGSSRRAGTRSGPHRRTYSGEGTGGEEEPGMRPVTVSRASPCQKAPARQEPAPTSSGQSTATVNGLSAELPLLLLVTIVMVLVALPQ